MIQYLFGIATGVGLTYVLLLLALRWSTQDYRPHVTTDPDD